MHSSKPRLGIALVISILVAASLACATFFSPDNTVETTTIDSSDNTSESVPTAPSTDLSDGSEIEPPPVVEDAPSEDTTSSPQTDDAAGFTVPPPPSSLEGLFSPFWEARDILHDIYVDQPVDDTVLMNGAIQGVISATIVGGQSIDTETALAYARAAGTPSDLENIYIPFWETWVNAEAPQDGFLLHAAIGGMLDSLGDQHTSYMDPDEFTQANISLDGDYEGIGAWVDPDGDYLTIVSPMPGSPAEQAGLESGDQVITVDGEDMTGIDGNLVIRRVLGPAGSEVILGVRREGEPDILEFSIIRDRILIPSVVSEMLDGNIAHVTLTTFGGDTGDDLREALQEMLDQNPDGLILDLRNNGGGFLTTAIEVASEFISEGVIMTERYGDGTEDVYDALRGGLATDIPMVVLVNEGSASASEIVAGAIQDVGRAPLVGAVTFGKGSVQNWVPLRDSQGAVRVTIARWYTPNERLIHEIGLEPDYLVEITEEDFNAGIDPQLEKAIEILTNP